MKDEMKRKININTDPKIETITESLGVSLNFLKKCERSCRDGAKMGLDINQGKYGAAIGIRRNVTNSYVIDKMGEVTLEEAFFMGLVVGEQLNKFEALLDEKLMKKLHEDEDEDEDDSTDIDEDLINELMKSLKQVQSTIKKMNKE